MLGKLKGWATLKSSMSARPKICRRTNFSACTPFRTSIWPMFLSIGSIRPGELKCSRSQWRSSRLMCLLRWRISRSRREFFNFRILSRLRRPPYSRIVLSIQKIILPLFWTEMNKKQWFWKITKILIGIWPKLTWDKTKWNPNSNLKEALSQSPPWK